MDILPALTLSKDWYLAKLKHESEDALIEVSWLNNQIQLIIETSKSNFEEECQSSEEVQKKLENFFGKKRALNIIGNWQEVSYRKV